MRVSKLENSQIANVVSTIIAYTPDDSFHDRFLPREIRVAKVLMFRYVADNLHIINTCLQDACYPGGDSFFKSQVTSKVILSIF